MFKNYFSIAVRNLKRNKIFSLINIAGLAIGISASLIILSIRTIKSAIANPVKSLRTE